MISKRSLLSPSVLHRFWQKRQVWSLPSGSILSQPASTLAYTRAPGQASVRLPDWHRCAVLIGCVLMANVFPANAAVTAPHVHPSPPSSPSSSSPGRQPKTCPPPSSRPTPTLFPILVTELLPPSPTLGFIIHIIMEIIPCLLFNGG